MESELSFYQTAMNSLFEGVYFVDRDRRITYWNQAAERITGFASSHTLGFRCMDNLLMHKDLQGNSLCEGSCPLAFTLQDGREHEAVVFVRHVSGRYLPVMMRTHPVLNDEGEVIGGIEIFEDLTALLTAEEGIEELEKAYVTDSLTGLLNQRAARIKVRSALAAAAQSGRPLSLLMVDIDRLQPINTLYGQQTGDEIIQLLACALTTRLPFLTPIARWGGDEFLVLLENMDAARLAQAAREVHRGVTDLELPTGKALVRATVSIGAVLAYPNEELPDLLLRGDDALQRAKREGRNRVYLALEAASAPQPPQSEAHES